MKAIVARFLIGVWATGFVTAIQAEGYKPVKCSEHAPYAGKPLHGAIDVSKLANALDTQPLGEAAAGRLDEAFDATFKASKSVAMTTAVAIHGKGLWQRGSAADSPVFFWASVGKTFTAVVLLQLADEGKLSLDDAVSRWLEDVPNGDVVTVRDLLAHTSGLFSANEDLRARAKPKFRSASENLEISRKHGAMFCAGANWRYTNTGYDLLGEIAAKVDGRPIEQAIAARIIQPLELRSTRALAPGSESTGIAPLVSTIERPMEPSWAGAAGPIVSNAADMIRFWSALLDGRLVKPATLEAMFATLYPMFDPGTYYGLGVMVFDVPDQDGQLLWLGHAGGTPGASAVVAYSPKDRAFVAVALTGDGPAVAVANQLLKAAR